MAAATYPAISFATEAKVTVKDDGTAHIDCCTQEIGTGTETVQCQLLADLLGIDVAKVSMKLGDSELPSGGVSGGSTTTLSVGAAVRSAVEELKKTLIKLLPTDSPMRRAKLEDVQFHNGQLVHANDAIAWPKVMQTAGQPTLIATARCR